MKIGKIALFFIDVTVLFLCFEGVFLLFSFFETPKGGTLFGVSLIAFFFGYILIDYINSKLKPLIFKKPTNEKGT